MMKKLLYIAFLISLFPTLLAAQLYKCGGTICNVTCPSGTMCHNIGSCANGSIKWGCVYPNGTVLTNYTAPVSTTMPTTTVQTTLTSVVPTAPTSVLPSTSLTFTMEVIAIIVIIIVIALLYYWLASRHIAK